MNTQISPIIKSRHLTILALAVALILVCLGAPGAQAATIITVDSGGGGDYTTIQAAVNNASPGDEIVVANGTYTENVNLNTMGSAIGGGPGDITIRALNSGLATVNGGATGPAFAATTFSGDITIQGFALDNDAGSPSGNEDGVIDLLNVTGTVQISDNDFDGNTSNSIAVVNTGGTSTTVIITDNTFTNMPNEDAIHIEAQGSGTMDLIVTDNTGSAMQNDFFALDIEGSSTVTGRVTGNVISNWTGTGDGVDISFGASGSTNVSIRLEEVVD